MLPEEYLRLSIQVALKLGPEHTCTGKVQHKTAKLALQAAKEVKERKGQEKNAYPCPWCFNWHIGRKMTPTELRTHANGSGSESNLRKTRSKVESE